MLKAQLAESVLRVAVGGQRASEITGDLLEQEEHGSLWWGVLTIVFGVTWRWLLAIASSAMLTLFLLFRYVTATQPSLGERIQVSWPCVLASLCVFSVLGMNSFRFGLRNRIIAVGTPLAVLLFATALVVSNSQVTYAGFLVTSVYLIGCLLVPGTRREMVCVLAPASVYAVCFWGLLHFMSGPGLVSPLVLATEFLGVWFVSFVCEARSLVWARRVLLP